MSSMCVAPEMPKIDALATSRKLLNSSSTENLKTIEKIIKKGYQCVRFLCPIFNEFRKMCRLYNDESIQITYLLLDTAHNVYE